MPPWYISTNCYTTYIRTNNQVAIHEVQYPTYVKDIDHDVHIIVFKNAIKLMVKPWKLISSTCLVSLSKIIFLNGMRIFSRSSKLHIWKTRTFFFCKWFQIVKIDEEVYMQLQNIQQQSVEHVKICYE